MGWRSDLLQNLPPRVSLPVRSRLGFSREPEMKALRRMVREGDHCVDIGCHLGIYAYSLLRLIGPAGTVTAFEPQPHLAGYLRAAFAPDIAKGRMELRVEALGPTAGTAVLHLPMEGKRLNRGRASLQPLEGTTRAIEVPVLRLDDAFPHRPVSFVKCDVEGYELEVLQGAGNVLERDQPVLLVEIESRHAAQKVEPTFDLLRSRGYTAAVYRARDDALAVLPTHEPDPAAIAARWAEQYVYNYIFVPEVRASVLTGAFDATT